MTKALLFTTVILLSSCVKDIVTDSSIRTIKYSDEEYDDLSEVLSLPRTFDNYISNGVFNSATRATLGRVLFYDKNLSKDGSVSCGSCHHQDLAFADNADLSTGIYGRKTDRNSLALGVFASFGNEYGSNGSPGEAILFWDLRVNNTQLQIESTMANEKEMGIQLKEVVDRIEGQRHYQILFDKAFETKKIEDHMVLTALENFMQSMSSSNSKFDQVQAGINHSNGASKVFMTDKENIGHKIFAANCASCHGKAINLFTSHHGQTMANNGLERVSHDRGFGEVSGNEENDGMFKIPSLRNIALTGPYMHDGRFANLSDVIDFYSEGIQSHDNLNPELRDENGNARKFNFTDEEKEGLVAFLNTLTDMSELRHSKFSDPWLK
jgi:cytochrome c peroxidase